MCIEQLNSLLRECTRDGAFVKGMIVVWNHKKKKKKKI